MHDATQTLSNTTEYTNQNTYPTVLYMHYYLANIIHP